MNFRSKQLQLLRQPTNRPPQKSDWGYHTLGIHDTLGEAVNCVLYETKEDGISESEGDIQITQGPRKLVYNGTYSGIEEWLYNTHPEERAKITTPNDKVIARVHNIHNEAKEKGWNAYW